MSAFTLLTSIKLWLPQWIFALQNHHLRLKVKKKLKNYEHQFLILWPKYTFNDKHQQYSFECENLYLKAVVDQTGDIIRQQRHLWEIYAVISCANWIADSRQWLPPCLKPKIFWVLQPIFFVAESTLCLNSPKFWPNYQFAGSTSSLTHWHHSMLIIVLAQSCDCKVARKKMATQ